MQSRIQVGAGDTDIRKWIVGWRVSGSRKGHRVVPVRSDSFEQVSHLPVPIRRWPCCDRKASRKGAAAEMVVQIPDRPVE